MVTTNPTSAAMKFGTCESLKINEIRQPLAAVLE
jgi:hypothetical protein